MDLRSLLQDVLSEVSSEVISFQIELHSLITWVKNSGLFQDYRIFEDMHHGITTCKKLARLPCFVRNLQDKFKISFSSKLGHLLREIKGLLD